MSGKRIVIRGLFLPGGMDELDDYIDAEYTSWALAGFKTRGIIKDYRAGKFEGPVDIIGHSLGANAALNMANALGAAGVPVGLVVMLDPTVRNRLRYGRGYAFQSRDFRAKEIDGATNFARPDLTHMSMTEDAKIIAFIKAHLSTGAV